MTRVTVAITLSVTIVSAILLFAPQVHAQKVCDPQDPTLCSQALHQGDVAPFTGQLLTSELAIRLGQKAELAARTIGLEVDFAKRQAAVDLNLEKQLHANDVAAKDREIALLKEQAKVPFYTHPAFVAPITAVVAVGLVVLSVWAAGQLK
jgi:hypothetical protein